MSHLTSIRSSLLPLLEAYADPDTQVKWLACGVWFEDDWLHSVPVVKL